MSPFHLAFPTTDLLATRRFFTEVIGCEVGREADRWIDFNFQGHQISAHKVDVATVHQGCDVDGRRVPPFHFGLVLDRDQWQATRERLENANAEFLIEPTIRFEGKPGEQATMFVKEPGGNVLEFKSMRDPKLLFAAQ